MFTNHVYLIYRNKQDLALNNLQWLIYNKTKPNQTNLFLSKTVRNLERMKLFALTKVCKTNVPTTTSKKEYINM